MDDLKKKRKQSMTINFLDFLILITLNENFYILKSTILKENVLIYYLRSKKYF